LEGTHHNLYSPSRLTLTKYNTLKNEAKASTSQSWATLEKLTFHWLNPPEISKRAATDASFTHAIPNKSGKTSSRVYPHTKSHARTYLRSISHLRVCLENFPQPFLIFFYNPTPFAPRGSWELQPPEELPNLESTTTLHQASLMPIAQSHFPKRAW